MTAHSSLDSELISMMKGVRMASLEEPRFNLVDEAWIPVRLKTGEVAELSLHDFF